MVTDPILGRADPSIHIDGTRSSIGDDSQPVKVDPNPCLSVLELQGSCHLGHRPTETNQDRGSSLLNTSRVKSLFQIRDALLESRLLNLQLLKAALLDTAGFLKEVVDTTPDPGTKV